MLRSTQPHEIAIVLPVHMVDKVKRAKSFSDDQFRPRPDTTESHSAWNRWVGRGRLPTIDLEIVGASVANLICKISFFAKLNPSIYRTAPNQYFFSVQTAVCPARASCACWVSLLGIHRKFCRLKRPRVLDPLGSWLETLPQIKTSLPVHTFEWFILPRKAPAQGKS